MRTLAPFAFARGVDPALLSSFVAKKSADAQDPAGYARADPCGAGARHRCERLQQIDAPTLILTGDDDRVDPSDAAATSCASGSPARDLAHDRRTPDHLFFIEQPEQTPGG